MSSDIDWHEDESVVVKSVSAVAVYTNTRGELVIRQENSMEEDQVIIVPMEQAKAIEKAILAQYSDSIVQ